MTSLKACRRLHWMDIEQVERDGPSLEFEAWHHSVNFQVVASRFVKRKSGTIGKHILMTSHFFENVLFHYLRKVGSEQ